METSNVYLNHNITFHFNHSLQIMLSLRIHKIYVLCFMSFCIRYFIDRLILITSTRFWQKLFEYLRCRGAAGGDDTYWLDHDGAKCQIKEKGRYKKIGQRSTDTKHFTKFSWYDRCICKVCSKDVPDKRMLWLVKVFSYNLQTNFEETNQATEQRKNVYDMLAQRLFPIEFTPTKRNTRWTNWRRKGAFVLVAQPSGNWWDARVCVSEKRYGRLTKGTE